MGFLNDFLEFVKQQYATFGYLIVFLGAYFENTILLGLILPGGSLVLLGAIYASEGTLWLPLVILFGWLGMFLGNSSDFWLGRLGVLRLIEKTRLKAKLAPHMLTAEKFLERRGGMAIFTSHFIGHLRSFVAITAGATRFPFARFARYELAAALIWNIMYCLVGFFFAKSISTMEGLFRGVGIGLVIVIAVVYIGYKIVSWLRSRQTPQIRPARKVEDHN
jgi:membrane protein DedA with SNARE-associated domain